MLPSLPDYIGSLPLAFMSPGPLQMVIVVVVVLLLFGNRLPGAMKSLGQSFVSFKKGMREGEDDNSDSEKTSKDESSHSR